MSSFKFSRYTIETYRNTYELNINEKFCKELSHYFIDADVKIVKPLTPELVHYYMTDARKLENWKTLSEEEQLYAERVFDYCDAQIYTGDLWTYDSEITEYMDNWSEI